MVDKIMSKILKGGQVGCVVGNRTLPGRGGCSAARGLVECMSAHVGISYRGERQLYAIIG